MTKDEYKNVIATVTDKGDPSVGIIETSFSVECPFQLDEVDESSLEFFR